MPRMVIKIECNASLDELGISLSISMRAGYQSVDQHASRCCSLHVGTRDRAVMLMHWRLQWMKCPFSSLSGLGFRTSTRTSYAAHLQAGNFSAETGFQRVSIWLREGSVSLFIRLNLQQLEAKLERY